MTKPSILIVDDTPSNLHVIASVLENIYQIYVATSGKQALDIMKKQSIQLILLDIMMPDMDGFAVASQIHKDPLTAMIPIIFLTAKHDSQSIIKSFETGGVDFITKPFEPKELLARVHTHLQIQHLTHELFQEKQRFALAIEGSRDGLWDWDMINNSMFVSERFETMLGYETNSLPKNVDASWAQLLHPDDKTKALEVVQEYLHSRGEGVYESTFRMRTKSGEYRWILGRGKALFSEEGTPLRFIGFNTDITNQIEQQALLDHSAKHDALTNLPNRYLLTELLTQAMKHSHRTKDHLALLFVDLDGFKSVNDTYGHDAGDALLKIMAQRMTDIIRSSDIVARFGGDEFIIMLTDLTSKDEIYPMVERLLEDFSLPIHYNGSELRISASIGISYYPQDKELHYEQLIQQADNAMYQAKSAGKNCFYFYNPEEEKTL